MTSGPPIPAFDTDPLWSQVAASDDVGQRFGLLSELHLRILAGLASGKQYSEIADDLGYKPKTIKNQGLVLLKRAASKRLRVQATGDFVRLCLPHLDRKARSAVQDHVNASELSETDREVLELLASGMSTDEIAVHLGSSRRTAKNHVSAANIHLGVTNRTAAVTLWIIANEDRN